MTATTFYCSHCGKEQSATAAFCSACGKPLQTEATTEKASKKRTPKPKGPKGKRTLNKKVIFAVLGVIAVAAFFGLQPLMRSIEENYVFEASDSDFSGEKNGEFQYIGSKEYVKIPDVIKGVEVTSYNRMFEDTRISGVKSTNPNITDMSNMFASSDPGERNDHLDLRQLNTENVTDMSGMFSRASHVFLNLDGFDTSSVTTMENMFSYSGADALYLDEFDTANVENMSHMFDSSYARDIFVDNFDTSNVTDMTSMFDSTDAEYLDLSSFDTTSVHMSIGNNGFLMMFMDANTNEVFVGTHLDGANIMTLTDKPSDMSITVK